MKLIRVNLKTGGTAFLNPDFIVGINFNNFEAHISLSHPIGARENMGNVAAITIGEFERLKPQLVSQEDENTEA